METLVQSVDLNVPHEIDNMVESFFIVVDEMVTDKDVVPTVALYASSSDQHEAQQKVILFRAYGEHNFPFSEKMMSVDDRQMRGCVGMWSNGIRLLDRLTENVSFVNDGDSSGWDMWLMASKTGGGPCAKVEYNGQQLWLSVLIMEESALKEYVNA